MSNTFFKIKDNMKITKKNRTQFIAIFYFLVFSFSLYKNYVCELGFSGFPSKFVAFIEAYLNPLNRLTYEVSAFPLFGTNPVPSDVHPSLQVLASTEYYFPNIFSLHLILHYITDMSPQMIMLLPIGALFLPICILFFMNTILDTKKVDTSKDNYIYLFVFLYMVLSLISRRNIDVFYTMPALFLMIMLMAIVKKVYCNENKPEFSIIYIISIFSLAHYWHSLLFFTVFFIFSIYLVSIIFEKIIQGKLYYFDHIRSNFFNTFVLGLLLSIIFTRLWRSSYLQLVVGDISIFNLIIDTIDKILGRQPFRIDYLYDYTSSLGGQIFHISLLLNYLLVVCFISIILFMYVAKYSRNYTKNKYYIANRNEIVALIFVFSIIVSEIIQIIAYYKSQSINLFFHIFYPLFAFNLLQNIEHKNKTFICILLALLVILSGINIISLEITNELGRTPITKFADTKASFDWSINYIYNNNVIFSDFNIMHKYLQLDGRQGTISYNYILLNPELYSILVGDSNNLPEYHEKYVVIDKATMLANSPIDIRGSRGFLLMPMYEEILDSENQHKIYDERSVSIFYLR